MLKLALLLLFVSSVMGTMCPIAPIGVADVAGGFPIGATNLTTLDKGTNCTLTFNIPNNYVILLTFSSDFQSDNDTVIIFDYNGQPKYELVHQGRVSYGNILYMPATSTQVQIVSVSGKTKFFLSYSFKSLANYQQVKKRTGDYFPLSTITPNSYYTFTASANEKVLLSYGLRVGLASDGHLSEYYVYDGDNINTAKMIGSLSEVGVRMNVSTGQSISIVNFFGSRTNTYVIGNDASTVTGYSQYKVYWMSKGSNYLGNMTDLNKGGLCTFICSDCSTFYLTQLNFDSWGGTVSNRGTVKFQGQTPTHRREQLITYEAMKFTNKQLPQMIPSNAITMNVFLSAIRYNLNTVNDDTAWKKAYDGRKGYIFSPSLWTSAANNFNYEFRDDAQLYNFTFSMDKLQLPVSSDQMTLKIGSGSGSPVVNNVYPRDQSSNGKVMANGNYMQVGLSASVNADVRLSFEIRKTSATTVTGILSAVILAVYYSL